MKQTAPISRSRIKVCILMVLTCALPLVANILGLMGEAAIALGILVPGFFTSGFMPRAINQILGPKQYLDDSQFRYRLSAQEFAFKAIILYLPACLFGLYFLMTRGILIPLDPTLLLVLALGTILYAAILPQAYLVWALKPPIHS